MKRGTRIAMYLLSGIVLTFVTASIAAMWPADVNQIGLARSEGSSKTWEVGRSESPTIVQMTYWHLQLSGRSLTIPDKDFQSRRVDLAVIPTHLRPKSLEDLTVWASFVEAGFPFRAASGSIRWKSQANNVVTYSFHGGVEIPPQRGADPRMLPFKPVWPAFIANTIIYAALALLIPRLFVHLRGRRRQRRGLCPRCCYDVKGLGPDRACPECGHELDGCSKPAIAQANE